MQMNYLLVLEAESENQSCSRVEGKHASGFSSSLCAPWNIDGYVCELISFPQMYILMFEWSPSYEIGRQIELASLILVKTLFSNVD